MGWIDTMALATGLPDPISMSPTPLWLLLVGTLALSAVGIASLALWTVSINSMGGLRDGPWKDGASSARAVLLSNPKENLPLAPRSRRLSGGVSKGQLADNRSPRKEPGHVFRGGVSRGH
jgi:hypothetical protein